MKKVLIAVDDTRSSRAVISTFHNVVSRPEEIVLVHVERIEGRSMMIDMLGEAEISTLKDMLRESEHKSELDRRAEKILDYYREQLDSPGITIKTVVRAGRPAEEILKVAREEGADLILLGYTKRGGIGRLITGSVAKDVKRTAEIPVLSAQMPLVCEESYSWRDAYTAISVTTAIVLGMFLLRLFVQHGIMH